MSLFQRPKFVPSNLKFDIKSIHEEVANFYSHGLGLILAILGMPYLLYYAFIHPAKYSFISCVIYGISLIMVYTSSTLYHSAYTLQFRRRMRIFDHISIYFLIAGSYTPYILIYLRTKTALTILAILWSMVVIGSIFKLFFTHKFKVVSTIAYLIMGWMALFIYKPMKLVIPLDALLWIKIGGGFYTFGIIFYLWKPLKHNHLIWHIFVLLGSISHYVSVLFLVK